MVALSLCGLSLACSSLRPLALPLPDHPQSNNSTSTPLSPPAADGPTEISLRVGHGFRGPWYEVYFTDPSNPFSGQYSGGLDQPLAAAIDAARVSVHAALYSLTLNDVRRALISAYHRGVDVRLVMESDNMDSDDAQALKDAGIPVLGDRRQGLMHNKFMVVDRTQVWTGSMNFTTSGVYSDDNNLLRIDSPQVAEDYEVEFQEMFQKDIFGPDFGDATPNPRVLVGGTQLEVYFSPDDHVQSALLSLLDGARSSITFLAFSYTSNALGDALARAAAAGVKVRGAMDTDQARSDQGSEYDALRAAGLDVRLDRNPGQMHDKVFIVDDDLLAVGSYNFTKSAETVNDENLVVIHSPQIAGLYLQEFERVYALARP